MPVWNTIGVDEVPRIHLGSWRVVELSVEGVDKKTRVLVGYNLTEGEGRVSSPIEMFDNGVATTYSGRKYVLVGSPGLNGDAEYTFQRWLGMRGALGERGELREGVKVEDVSDEYETEN